MGNLGLMEVSSPEVTNNGTVTENNTSISNKTKLGPEGKPKAPGVVSKVIDKAKEVVTSPIMTVEKLATRIS
jgi:hypothetical protein